MALTTPFETYERPGLVVAYRMSNVKIYKGAAVGLNTSGHAIPMTHATANLKFIGIANETVDNSGGSAGGKSISITKSGSFVFKSASGFTPAQTNVGAAAYCSSDWEVVASAGGLTNTYQLGTIVAVEATSTAQAGVRVRIDNYTV